MAASKGKALWGIKVRQHKRHLPAELWPERVDDALELGTVRSAR